MRYILCIIVACFILSQEQHSVQYENLKKWILDNNGFISPKISVNESQENNRFVVANENIDAKEELMFIPDQIQLNVINPILAKTCSMVQYMHLSKGTECLVYFIALDSLNENSIFKDYYNYLPKSFNEFPIYYTDENDLNLIDKSGLAKEYYNLQTKIDSSYQAINSFLPHSITYDTYKFWYVMVTSRTFSRIFYSNEIPTLVPFLELCNHASQTDNADYYYDEDKKGFCLKSIKPIRKNEEITIMYHYHLDNILLLSKYGFILKDNPNQIGFYINIRFNKYYLNGYFFQKAIMEVKELIQKDFPKMTTYDILYAIRDFLKTRKDNLKRITTSNTLLKTVLEEEYHTAQAFLEAVTELI